jgi:hypothetical protein
MGLKSEFFEEECDMALFFGLDEGWGLVFLFESCFNFLLHSLSLFWFLHGIISDSVELKFSLDDISAC